MYFSRFFVLLLVLALHPNTPALALPTPKTESALPELSHTVASLPDLTMQRPFLTNQTAWTTFEIVLSIAVLLFGALVFALQNQLMLKLKLEWTPNSILRFNGLTLIITGGVLLCTAGYSQEQMAPAMGLFGTIAGYLLGSTDTPKTFPAREPLDPTPPLR